MEPRRPLTLTMEAGRLKMELWRVCKPGHFDEEQDTDPDPHSSEKLDPDSH
jgi:hypothetical protein